jgi:hypothetical protein
MSSCRVAHHHVTCCHCCTLKNEKVFFFDNGTIIHLLIKIVAQRGLRVTTVGQNIRFGAQAVTWKPAFHTTLTLAACVGNQNVSFLSWTWSKIELENVVSPLHAVVSEQGSNRTHILKQSLVYLDANLQSVTIFHELFPWHFFFLDSFDYLCNTFWFPHHNRRRRWHLHLLTDVRIYDVPFSIDVRWLDVSVLETLFGGGLSGARRARFCRIIIWTPVNPLFLFVSICVGVEAVVLG